jgi:tellurite resistance protein
MTNETDYSEDSRTAVLRVAILVTYSDTSWHELEREHLEDVYRNICVMLDEDLDDELFARELDEISTDVPAEIEDLSSDEDLESYWQDCIESIVSEDIQQLAVAAALALSMGDSEIDPNEMSGIARLCAAWDVALKDAAEVWND